MYLQLHAHLNKQPLPVGLETCSCVQSCLCMALFDGHDKQMCSTPRQQADILLKVMTRAKS